MRWRRWLSALPWVLAALAVTACSDNASGPAEPGAAATNQAIASDDASAFSSEPEQTGHYKRGVNYIRLSPTQPTSSSPTRIEVAEVFSYGNPASKKFEPLLDAWLDTAPPYVHFVRIPAVWNSTMRRDARVFYTAQALGKTDAVNHALFSATEQPALDSQSALANFFTRFKVDKADFAQTFRSYPVQVKMQRADALNRRYRVKSLPSMVVNGKYVTNPTMAGSYQDMLQLVDKLVASERAAKEP